MRMKHGLSVAIAMIASSYSNSPALAWDTQYTAIGAVNRYRKEPAVHSYVEGLVEGIWQTNSQLEAGTNGPFFCTGKIILTLDQQMDILARYISKSDGQSYPVGTMMLLALEDALPCKK